MKKTKKITVEKSSKKLKMILYREENDGGIQGILMDFYINESGVIANEFYGIDKDGNLIKIENGIKPIKDKASIEKVFKQYFLKY